MKKKYDFDYFLLLGQAVQNENNSGISISPELKQ